MDRRTIVQQIAETFGIFTNAMPCLVWVHLSEPEGIPETAEQLKQRIIRRSTSPVQIDEETVNNILFNLEENGFVVREGLELPARYIAVDPSAEKTRTSAVVDETLSPQPDRDVARYMTHPEQLREFNGIRYFPDYTLNHKPGRDGRFPQVEAMTIIRVKRDGKWYVLLLKEMIIQPNTRDEDMVRSSQMIIRLLKKAYTQSILWDQPKETGALDLCQLDEADRLAMLEQLSKREEF